MKSIQKEVIEELIINKSKFINYLAPITNVEEAKTYMITLRKKHPDANHHCYAYIVGDSQSIQKFSDDGEPSKTAGLPMLEVLKKNDLTDVINVSVRYFGGIKLGAGGLVRAYTKGCAQSVKNSLPSIKTSFTTIRISIEFDYIGVCEKHLRDTTELINTTYDDKVHYDVIVRSDYENTIKSEITQKTKGSALFSILNTERKYI